MSREMTVPARRSVALPLVVLMAGAACAKVKEQPAAPVAAQPAEEEAPPPPTRQPRRPPPRPTNGAFGSRTVVTTTGQAAPAAESPAGEAFSRDKLHKTLEAALPSLNPCFPRGTVSQATIAFDASGAGKAENVRVTGGTGDQQRCVAGHISALPLPTFAGPSVGVQLPITFGIAGLTQKPDPGAPVEAAPAPAAAPVFVNP